jgi:hypothetical protein
MSVIGLISIPGLMTGRSWEPFSSRLRSPSDLVLFASIAGAIIGGSSVDQAAKLQMVRRCVHRLSLKAISRLTDWLNSLGRAQILMFMISASSALSTLAAGAFCLTTVVDKKHRIRPDRIVAGGALSGGIRSLGTAAVAGGKKVGRLVRGKKDD